MVVVVAVMVVVESSPFYPEEINYPTGFRWANILAYGTISMVCLDPSTTPQTVIKFPHSISDAPAIDIERKIYERFEEHGGHKHIVRYHGTFEHAIRLEYVPNWNFKRYLDTNRETITQQQTLTWARQLADALSFVHERQVIYGDLNVHNVLLDANLDVKLADFAGSSMDGSELLVVVTASHLIPGENLSIQGDLFALGSTLYRIATGLNPYSELEEDEIETRFLNGEFPETKSLGRCGEVVSGCWRGEYTVADRVREDIEDITSNNQPHIYNFTAPSSKRP
ncbi:kinase-like protein [Aulographum hederae CBS 113979]|uniref:Kinase-like protein n=1 Tax=Aulographum hederae CBS 113979 TaxID=1176131 RepID=A0A6G1HB92_9PEZI|nr:kinase-like protein [Aulographum hederae CBS 113979]